MEKEEIYKDIKKFHQERISRLKNNDTPKQCREGGKVVLHLIPINYFLDQNRFNVTGLSEKYGDFLTPFYSEGSGFYRSYNYDGLFNFMLDKDEKCISYIQLYRNGAIEAVDSFYLTLEEKSIPIYTIEKAIILKTDNYLKFQNEIKINPPIICFLALLGAKRYEIIDSSIRIETLDIHPFDRDDLILPEIIIGSYDIDTTKLYKTNFDRIWNACGYPRSFQYDKKGEFKPK